MAAALTLDGSNAVSTKFRIHIAGAVTELDTKPTANDLVALAKANGIGKFNITNDQGVALDSLDEIQAGITYHIRPVVTGASAS
jgi:hypothetical protein